MTRQSNSILVRCPICGHTEPWPVGGIGLFPCGNCRTFLSVDTHTNGEPDLVQVDASLVEFVAT